MSESLVEKMRKFYDSVEGKESIEKYRKEIEFENLLKNNNVERFKKMFNNQETFDNLVYRIISKHDDNWRDKCYKNGFMPYPKTLMYTLFDLAKYEGKYIDETLDKLTEHFPSDIYDYNGWQFALTYGQGTCGSIYHNKVLKYRD